MAGSFDDFELDIESLEKDLKELDTVLTDSPSEEKITKDYDVFIEVKRILEKGDISNLSATIDKLGSIHFEDRDLDNFRKLIKNSLVLIAKQKYLFRLVFYIKENLEIYLKNRDEKILKNLILMYKKSKEYGSRSNLNDSDILESINNIISSKLHEINIKIEENQRILHRLISDGNIEENIEKVEKIDIDDYFRGKGVFIKVVIGSDTYVLDQELIVNKFKVNKNKAKKLAKKSFIRLEQLLSLFSSPLKGAKGSLLNYSPKEAKKLKVYPFSSLSMKSSNPKWALLLEIEEGKYGVLFVDKVEPQAIEGEIERDFLRSEKGTFNIINPQKVWQEQQEIEVF